MTESPKALEAEVEANRANVEQTLDALRGKATMQGVVGDVTRYIGIEDARGTLEAAGRQVSSNPLAFGLLAAGLACLATGVTRRNPYAAYSQRPYDGMNRSVVSEPEGPSMKTKARAMPEASVRAPASMPAVFGKVRAITRKPCAKGQATTLMRPPKRCTARATAFMAATVMPATVRRT